jgi:RimJ/RimL family protein N-acetyltransferase
MDDKLFEGKLVRIAMADPEVMGEAFSRWVQNSEYFRLIDTDLLRNWSAKKAKEWFEGGLEKDDPCDYTFLVHTLKDDKLIGFFGLWVNWNNGEAWIGIGIGESEFWGKGYGTDAMRLALRYAFHELNLRRVTLGVFEYNERAQKSYLKAGFVHEGRIREEIHRNGQRWDAVQMGILREEWEKQSTVNSNQ